MTGLFKVILDDRGATAIEYGLIVALIGVAIMGGVNLFADETISMWNGVANTLDNAIE